MRPVLAVGFIAALMAGNEFDGIDERLRDAERWLEPATGDGKEVPASSKGMVVVDEQELSRLPGVIEMYRAALALVRGDTPATLRHARLAIDRAADEDDVTRAGASAISGLTFWGRGDLEDAHHAYSSCVEGLRRAGHLSDVLGCSITLADIRTTQGRLGDAQRTFERALQLAAQEPGTVLRGTPDMYVGMSQIACERGDLHTATQYLFRSQELGERTGLPQNPYRWRVAMALVRESQGDLAGALTLLDDAQRVYLGDFLPNVRPVPALRARVLAAQGRWREALDWSREQGLSADDNPTYVQEFAHITLAKVLLTRYASDGDKSSLNEASRLLDRLQSAAVAGGRTGSEIEILVLRSLTLQAGGDTFGALAPLVDALTLAEPEGYVRIFVGAGPPMKSLLTAVIKKRGESDYVRRLLAAYADDDGPVSTTPPGGPAPRHGQGLVEPLSERELDVLGLLATDLDGPDIARRLFVSVNTMRSHTRSIYAKLGVNSRRAAVSRAEELGLVSHDRDH
jgi:LuxR family maltose regulon positive regulatory protein